MRQRGRLLRWAERLHAWAAEREFRKRIEAEPAWWQRVLAQYAQVPHP